MPRTLSRRKLLLFRGAAVLIPMLVGTAIGVVWWWSTPLYLEETLPPGTPPTHHRFVYDELLGWKNVPGFRSTTFGRPLTINSLGMRGPERPQDKPPGVKRILVLGDSYAWGYGVADSEVFPALLEHRLIATDRQWEVLNAAVLGWGTDQEYLYLKRDGFSLSPDLVVVALFLLNDPMNSVMSGKTTWPKPIFRNASLRDLDRVPCPRPRDGAPSIWNNTDPIDMVVALLAKMGEECRQRNCQLVVMKFGGYLDTGPSIPWLPQNRALADIEKSFHARLRPLVEDRELHYLDLDRAFARRGLAELQLQSQQTSHWTPLGHAAAAEILHEFLSEHGLVPSKP